MKSVQQVELDRDLVSNPTLDALFVFFLWDLNAWIKGPRSVLGVKPHQDTKIVVDRDVDVQSTSDPIGSSNES